MQTIIGITGGTGCGKTTVLQVLQELGVHVIDCDALYHELLQTDQDMLSAINETFPGVVQNGVLQRKLLGRQVFSNRDALDKLNKTVWPFVFRAVERWLHANAPKTCAIDAIGLFESGLSELCSHTIAVTAPEGMRIKRLMARDDITEDYAKLRIQAQKQNEHFSSLCTLTLDNRFSSKEEFYQYAKQILKETIL